MVEFRQMVLRCTSLLLVIACLLCFPIFTRAEVPKAEDVLQKMIRSSETVRFIGKRIVMSNTSNGAMMHEELITQEIPYKKRIEFISPSEMGGLVMVLNGKEPGRSMMFNKRERPPFNDRKDRKPGRRPFSPPPPMNEMDELPIKNARVLLQNYNVLILYGGHVARRNTYLLEIEPKIYGKPSRKVWVDTITSVPLKMEHYDYQRKLRWIFTYNDINFNPKINDAVFRPQVPPPPRKDNSERRQHNELWNSDKGKLDINTIRKTIQMDIVAPEQLPDGFSLQSINLMRFDDHKSVHLIYSDGLMVLSVFQSPSGDEDRRNEQQREHINIWKINVKGVELEVISDGNMLIPRWKHGDINLTLIGELDLTEMKKIAGAFIG